MQIGPCRASITRYFYNKKTCKCERFYWGGCQPNANNFNSLSSCQASCERQMQSNPICKLDNDNGNCKTNWNLNRWRYNTYTCRCEMFKWDGCGNANNFLTKESCEASCGCYDCKGSNPKPPTTTTNCLLPKESGPCKAAIKRFYYNPQKQKCQKFFWGGCQPNGNNFVSKKICKKTCKDAVCSLPVKVGPCRARVKRYYYDSNRGECKMFYWGGCESNGNNFKSASKCRRACY